MPQYNGFAIDIDCDFTFTLGINDSSGNPTDLTGSTLKMVVAAQDGTTLATLPTNGTVTNTGSQFVCTLPHTYNTVGNLKTAQLANYDLVITDGNNVILKRLFGTVPIRSTLSV